MTLLPINKGTPMSDKFLTALKHAVQALAQPAMIQDKLYPDSLSKGDEMALQFDEAYEAVDNASIELNATQDAALNELDDYIDKHSPEEEDDDSMDDFWCDATVMYKDPRWEEIRKRADAILVAFEWENAVPPMSIGE